MACLSWGVQGIKLHALPEDWTVPVVDLPNRAHAYFLVPILLCNERVMDHAIEVRKVMEHATVQ